MRKLPNLKKPNFIKSFGKLIGVGLDTLEETYDLEIAKNVLETMEKAKSEAQKNMDGTPTSFRLGSEEFQMLGHSAQGGVVFIFGNSNFLVRIRPRKEWPVSIRYLAGGLWGEGYPELKAQALILLSVLQNGKKTEIDERIKRADFAFDFYSPKFSEEIKNRGGALYDDIVAHSSVKRKIEGAGNAQTITIGSKSRLEVQIYDKGREIREHSGKTWMFDLWERNGWKRPEDEITQDGEVKQGKVKGVWRLECRFGKEFLRNRGIITTYEFLGAQKQLVCEALFERRLAKRSKDKNRSRWPLHPLWFIASEYNGGDEMLPIGKRITMRRLALSQMLLAQAAGVLRARCVLDTEEFEPEQIKKITENVGGHLLSVASDRSAVDRARERYKHVDDMR